MAKTLSDAFFDAALNYLKNNADEMNLCSAQPTTYTEAITTYSLADVAMASGDYTVANGTTSGRKATTTAKTAIPVDASGTGNHVAHTGSTGSLLIWVTTCTGTAVTSGGTVDIGAHVVELNDPT